MQSPDIYIALFLSISIGFSILAVWARRQMRLEAKALPGQVRLRPFDRNTVGRRRYR